MWLLKLERLLIIYDLQYKRRHQRKFGEVTATLLLESKIARPVTVAW